MLLKSLLSTGAALAAVLSSAFADVSPNYPSPGTVWTAGKSYKITWDNTASSQGDWSNFTIDFMTGDNLNMVFLTNVAKGLDGAAKEYTWTAPHVDPYSAIYFFQFTSATGEHAWTTRFAIVANDGDVPVKEPNAKQPNGGPIPWGVGKLASAPVHTANVTIAAVSTTAIPTTSTVTPAVSTVTTVVSVETPSQPGKLSSSPETNEPSAVNDVAKNNQGAATTTMPSKFGVIVTSAVVLAGWSLF